MELCLSVIAILAFVALFFGIAAFTRSGALRRDEVWRALAERRGARFTARGSSYFRNQPATVEARVEAAIVFLDTHVVSHGKSSTMYSRARAHFATGRGPYFDVYKEHVFSTLGKMLGTQDVVLGSDRAFDDHFMVKCEDPEAVRRRWDVETQRRLLAALPGARVESDTETVTLNLMGHVDETRQLEAMLEIVGRLATGCASRLEALAGDLDTARYEPPSGGWEKPEPPRLKLSSPRGEVLVTAHGTANDSRLRLRIRSEHAMEPFALGLGPGPLPPEAPRALADGSLDLAQAALEGASLRGDGRRVTLLLEADADVEVLRAGVDLLYALARPPTTAGAFR